MCRAQWATRLKSAISIGQVACSGMAAECQSSSGGQAKRQKTVCDFHKLSFVKF
jgi:hypothetical protein